MHQLDERPRPSMVRHLPSAALTDPATCGLAQTHLQNLEPILATRASINLPPLVRAHAVRLLGLARAQPLRLAAPGRHDRNAFPAQPMELVRDRPCGAAGTALVLLSRPAAPCARFAGSNRFAG